MANNGEARFKIKGPTTFISRIRRALLVDSSFHLFTTFSHSSLVYAFPCSSCAQWQEINTYPPSLVGRRFIACPCIEINVGGSYSSYEISRISFRQRNTILCLRTGWTSAKFAHIKEISIRQFYDVFRDFHSVS